MRCLGVSDFVFDEVIGVRLGSVYFGVFVGVFVVFVLVEVCVMFC